MVVSFEIRLNYNGVQKFYRLEADAADTLKMTVHHCRRKVSVDYSIHEKICRILSRFILYSAYARTYWTI